MLICVHLRTMYASKELYCYRASMIFFYVQYVDSTVSVEIMIMIWS